MTGLQAAYEAAIAKAAGDPTLVDRTWVLLTEAPEGGWACS